MNWYKIAQQIIPNLSKSERIYWIDPEGIIYVAKKSHFEWVIENKDFLQSQYNIVFPSSSLGWTYEGFLLERGWVRGGCEHSWYFEIETQNNINLLKMIESKLYEILSPADTDSIVVDGDDSKISIFNWNDYINSGQNFVDFVRKVAYNAEN